MQKSSNKGINNNHSSDLDNYSVTMVGLGGWGVITVGRLLADAGLSIFKHVTFTSSYSSAQRGEHVECTVRLSNDEIASPVLLHPRCIVVMGPAMLKRFQFRLRAEQLILLDNELFPDTIETDGVEQIQIPARSKAVNLGNPQVASMVMLGAYLAKVNPMHMDLVDKALEKRFDTSHPEVLSMNKSALWEGSKLVINKKSGHN